MLFLYDLGIQIYRLLIFLASVKNEKAAAWINGRKKLLQLIESQVGTSSHRVWFHFASLGEFEQGRPVLEELKSKYPLTSIVITFFSPSGYDIRKDYILADYVFYLPLDTRKNAHEFISLVRPSIAIFTKYEYWYHYFEALHKFKVPLFIVSGIFRRDQPFFRWYGGLHRRMLARVSHFFVQNESSRTLLKTIGFRNVSVTGDTRFDRVLKNAGHISDIPEVREFCNGHRILIAGSTWPEDELLLASLASEHPDWKFIIAPHEVYPEHIREIEHIFKRSVKLSQLKTHTSAEHVLIIDNIGMLSSLYQYGDIAYIGGGFGVGIHNTQEAAAFGLPVIFGPNYQKFQEALDLVAAGAFFSVKSQDELNSMMKYLENADTRAKLVPVIKNYVLEKAGATDVIMDYLEKQGFLH